MNIKNLLLLGLIFSVIVLGCNKKDKQTSLNTETDTNTKSVNKKSNTTTETQLTQDGYVASESGTEKEKPEAGKANVQGVALFNEKPAANVEVRLCEKFNTFSGCSGQQYKSKTDENGEYLLKGVEPKIYDALLVKVFNTNMSIFASQRFGITPAKYKIDGDKTFFAPPTNLYKADLKIQTPKPNAKIDAKELELKWDAYADAAYYKFGMYPKNPSVTAPYVSEQTDQTSFKGDKPLVDGEYNVKIEAYNANDVKIAETQYIPLKITGGEAAPANDAANK